jgi:hypothetical protein
MRVVGSVQERLDVDRRLAPSRIHLDDQGAAPPDGVQASAMANGRRNAPLRLISGLI